MFFDFVIDFLFRVFKKYKKKIIIKKLFKLTHGRIFDGPYKNIILDFKMNYSGDLPSKLLGTYEEQISKKIFEINKKKKLKYLINFGSADGYHVIGLIKKKIFEKALAFEINRLIQKKLFNNIKKNNLLSKIKILGKASFNDVIRFINSKDLSKSMYLVDIEGEEFNLFNNKNLDFFKNSVLIIENHEKLLKNKKKLIQKFLKLINQNFYIQILENDYKNPFKIKALESFDEDSRWLSMSECRPSSQNWLICFPKKIIN